MRAPQSADAGREIRRAASVNVAELFRQRAQAQPQLPALRDAATTLSYGELAQRVRALAAGLRAAGLHSGERIALLSENRIEYLELELAAAETGAIVACLNWRLADDELLHCIRLVSPAMVIASPRHAATLARLDLGAAPVITLGSDAFERLRTAAPSVATVADAGDGGDDDDDTTVDAESGLVILYTSGTTGLPKGALVSQRAMVARAQVFAADYGIGAREGFLAWSPLFHMAATDHALATLMLGGTVFVSDGLDVDRLCALLETQPLGWLLAMPGMIEPLIDALKAHRAPRIAPKMVGAMADLVPRHQIAELSGLLRAPYLNSFGSTETGLPPASASLLPPGEAPASLAKRQSSLCRVRLVDADDCEVGLDEPGEMTVRGPTLFSGYWNAEPGNAHDFRGGWFHLGDMFVRHADGTLDFVDRLKYLIKSGGENIYPAEIERVLLAHAAVADAAVVRKPDARWGEVPVAFVALKSPLDAGALTAWCRERLAHYKVPREFRFIELAALPRSSTGKIQRHEIERRMV